MNNRFEIVGEVWEEPRRGRMLAGEQMWELLVEVRRTSGVYDSLAVEMAESFLAEKPRLDVPVRYAGYMDTWNEDGHLRIVGHATCVETAVEGPGEEANLVQLTGAVCRPTKYRVTPRGREITDMMIAVRKGKGGLCCYIPCIAWGATARIAGYLKVGERVQLEGRWQSRDYTKLMPDGTERPGRAWEISIIRMRWAGDSR